MSEQELPLERRLSINLGNSREARLRVERWESFHEELGCPRGHSERYMNAKAFDAFSDLEKGYWIRKPSDYLPPRYSEASFDDFREIGPLSERLMRPTNISDEEALAQTRATVDFCHDWSRRHDLCGISIYGGAGAGKTHLMAAAVKDLIALGANVGWVSYWNFLYMMDNLTCNQEAVKKLLRNEVVVLDGMVYDKESEQALDFLIRSCYDRRTIFCMTSGQSQPFDFGTTTRLKQMTYRLPFWCANRRTEAESPNQWDYQQ